MRRTLARPEMTSVGGSDVAEINNQSICTAGVPPPPPPLALATDLPRFLLAVGRPAEVVCLSSGVCFVGDYSITILYARADSRVSGPWVRWVTANSGLVAHRSAYRHCIAAFITMPPASKV